MAFGRIERLGEEERTSGSKQDCSRSLGSAGKASIASVEFVYSLGQLEVLLVDVSLRIIVRSVLTRYVFLEQMQDVKLPSHPVAPLHEAQKLVDAAPVSFREEEVIPVQRDLLRSSPPELKDRPNIGKVQCGVEKDGADGEWADKRIIDLPVLI